MVKKIFFFIVILISISGFSQESTYDIISLDKCTGFANSGEPELYVGDDLFNLINGGAELYHEYGFVEVLAAEIIDQEGNLLKVEVYDMGSPESAWGIYSITSTSNAKAFTAGDAGRQGEGFAQFVKGNYMLYLYFTNISAEGLQYIAGCIAENIDLSFSPPRLMMDVIAGRAGPEKNIYFKGNLGLSAMYNFHYKDMFAYTEGAAAIYKDLMVFLLAYPDIESCNEGFLNAKEFLLNSSKYHDQSAQEDSFSARDRKDRYISCFKDPDYLLLFVYSGDQDIKALRENIENARNISITPGN